LAPTLQQDPQEDDAQEEEEEQQDEEEDAQEEEETQAPARTSSAVSALAPSWRKTPDSPCRSGCV